MHLDYDSLAAGYDGYRRGRGPAFDALLEVARTMCASHVLEIGAGTGNNTAAFLEALPCVLTALEPSAGMIVQAQRKALPCNFLRASATALPFAKGRFDFIFGTYMLHHIQNLHRLFNECAHALGTGCAAFVTVPTAFIKQHPMNRYFPSFADIDLARFQTAQNIEDAMTHAGFNRVQNVLYTDSPKPIDAEYVERVAEKFISTYALLPPAEFEAGLAQLHADIEEQGVLEVTIAREAILIWGYK